MANQDLNEIPDESGEPPVQLLLLEELMVVSALARSVVALGNESREKSEWGQECQNALGVVADHMAKVADGAYSQLDRFFSASGGRRADGKAFTS